MKKIGIITWYGGSNYGTSLQAFALSFMIERMGCKPYLLKHRLKWRNLLGLVKRFIMLRNEKLRYNGFGKEKKDKIKKFKIQNFNFFPTCVGYLGRFLYSRQIKNLSCIISGSDQLWNPYHTTPFLLLQGFNTKKYSYASSIGVKSIPLGSKRLYKDALSDFISISVREESAINPLEEITGETIRKVVDPTFLLTKNDWESFANESTLEIVDSPYILCYFIANREDYWDKVNSLKEKTNIQKVIVVPMQPTHFRGEYELLENVGLNDFIYLIQKASIVCTDSFHATALSINLNRNFVTLLRFNNEDVNSQNSRLVDLLKHYGLSSQLFIDSLPTIQNIEYSYTNKILDKDRKESYLFLKEILDNC